jgi:hypothetical protein
MGAYPAAQRPREGQPPEYSGVESGALSGSGAGTCPERVSDPNVRPDVALEHVTRITSVCQVSRRQPVHPDDRPRRVQERNGDRGRHADRVHRTTPVEEHRLARTERSPAEATHPFPGRGRPLGLPSLAPRSDDDQPSHGANLGARTDMTSNTKPNVARSTTRG